MSLVLNAPRLPDRIRLLGCLVDRLTNKQALQWCLDACRCREAPARILLTANASHLVAMEDDAALRQAGNAADLVTADGMSLVWASWLTGTPLPERVTGIDLLTRLLEAAPREGIRVFLLGATQPVIERFVAHCREAHPGIEIAGWRNGYFDPEDASVVRQIAESRADLLLVGMPSPRKDIWCERYRDEFDVRLIIGVGGAFDVLAGMVRRAPRWMQVTGLEWAWRLLLEPKRLWRRYLFGNCRFIWLLLRDALGGNRPPPPRVA
jgi:N-acetylglucosaminyldiphosphoundecaprenol N-acetyl-beta-D-mannosaminyltransferase